MRALYDFLVDIPELQDNTINVAGNDIFLDTRFDEFSNRISHGTIVATPAKFDTPAEVGDTLIFHHHINMEDKYKFGDLYMVTFDPTEMSGHAYAVIKPSGETVMLGDWLFLKAEKAEKTEQKSASGLFLGIAEDDTVNTEAPLYSESPVTKELGISVGDIVGFDENSDYRIKLPNGDEVFRMKPWRMKYVKL